MIGGRVHEKIRVTPLCTAYIILVIVCVYFSRACIFVCEPILIDPTEDNPTVKKSLKHIIEHIIVQSNPRF